MNLFSPRMRFQKRYATGRILNIGSGEDPVALGQEVVHFDIDRWRHPYFVQGDAHHLPFPDRSFDTCVLGDMLEHVLRPRQVLEEACRVARDRVVMTVFEDWVLGEPGQHLEAVQRGAERLKAAGFASQDEYNSQYAGTRGKWVKGFPEEVMPHGYHINQFTDGAILELLSGLPLPPVVMWKEPEAVHEGHQWNNWLILLGTRMMISVLIPYRYLVGTTNLENCLKSLGQQMLLPVQIILCDESLPEHQPAVQALCAQYGVTYTSVPHVEVSTPQFARMYNAMFPLVEGDMVLILCSNWVLGPLVLEQLATLLERLGPHHMVASDVARTNMGDAQGKPYDFFQDFPEVFPVWTSIKQAPPAQLLDEGFMNLMWREDWIPWDEEFDPVGAWHAVIEWGHRLINQHGVKLWIRRGLAAHHQERAPQPGWLDQTARSQAMLFQKVESLSRGGD